MFLMSLVFTTFHFRKFRVKNELNRVGVVLIEKYVYLIYKYLAAYWGVLLINTERLNSYNYGAM